MKFVGGPIDGNEIPPMIGASEIHQPVVLNGSVLRTYLIGFDQDDRAVTYTVHTEDWDPETIPWTQMHVARYTPRGEYLGIQASCSDPKCERCPMDIEWDSAG